MKRRAFLLFFICILNLPLFCFEHQQEEGGVDIVVIEKDQVINADYFSYGRSIEISGTVNGDVYLLGGQVLIDGQVNGSVFVAAGSVEITGRVAHDLHLIGGQSKIEGEVGRNILAMAAAIEIAKEAHIGNNSILLSGNVDLDGDIKNNARIYASNLRISERVEGDVTAYVGQMRIAQSAYVGGKVEYWSNKSALIDPQATILNGAHHHPPFFHSFFEGKIFQGIKLGSKLATRVMNFLYTFIIGLILIRYFHHRIARTITTLNKKPFRSILAGVIMLFLLPLLSLILLVTILGVPFALTILSYYSS